MFLLTYITNTNLTCMTKKILAFAVFAALALPGMTYAANYAYVNASGDVSMVTAASPGVAIASAPNIATHSGVLLLDSTNDAEVVGDSVSGF